MGCCGGSCSCGKGSQSPAGEKPSLVQMSASQSSLSTSDFILGLESLTVDEEVFEIRFKNNRKAFFRNSRGYILQKDDRVVVEVEGGFDLGTVSLKGGSVNSQFDYKEPGSRKASLRRIDRKATQMDLNRWLEAKRRERDVLFQARSMVAGLQLDMSINDVEFQGDGKRITIFYTADNRVDFREFIRIIAGEFGVEISMKQIGRVTSIKAKSHSSQGLLN